MRSWRTSRLRSRQPVETFELSRDSLCISVNLCVSVVADPAAKGSRGADLIESAKENGPIHPAEAN
jgi:hypothetical protein